MSKLVIVSNRVPAPNATEAGGLSVALKQMLVDRGGNWLGWSGKITDDPQVHERIEQRVRYKTMDLETRDYDGFYTGLSNSILWPLLHYRMDLCSYVPEMWESYQRVNKKFAEQVATVAGPKDLIWVHDYHLMVLGKYLREQGMRQRVGFFLHVPFPVPEVFVALPHHAEILEALSSYDIVGFQTDTDLHAFLRCLTDLFKIPVIVQLRKNLYEVTAFGRTFHVGKFAISIDTNEIAEAAMNSCDDEETIKLKNGLGDRKMLIGVDRLDYTKGLVERLTAFEALLNNHQEYRSAVSYIQITPPSRSDVKDYQLMREELEKTAAHINGKNAEINWVPIQYINRSFCRNELAGFYRSARVGLVTPLRDGMNLVAKEYVASQDPRDPGVLVLSQFAGAADELKVGALLCNPYNVEETAETIHRALTMSLEERQERYHAMMAILKRDDIFLWTKRFIACLKGEGLKAGVPEFKDDRATAFGGELGRKIGNYIPSLSDLIKNLSMTG